MKKRWTKVPADPEVVRRLSNRLPLSRTFCHLLAQRGVTSAEAAEQFFLPELSDLHDPFLMCDMEAAAERLLLALRTREPILLYGDYDVDGTTSIALMHAFLEKLDADVDYYVPHREREGYGLSYGGIDYAHRNGRTLIIAMDCGIKAVSKVDYAREMRLDVIICDHHKPDSIIPGAVAVLNPKRSDCDYPFDGLSGCGVAFKLAQAVARKLGLPAEELYDLLDYLVISIAADIVPMVGENRILAYHGLRRLNETDRPGLRAFLHYTGRQLPLDIGDVVFGIAPSINAAGRLDDADIAVEVLVSKEDRDAQLKLNVLGDRNRRRKLYDRNTAAEATALYEADPELKKLRTIVLYKPGWHKGVVGIVASRIVEKFHKPTIILTESGGQVVGSARSVRGFNIHEALAACAEHLDSFGGHAYAAGMKLSETKLPAFRAAFEQSVAERIQPEHLVPEVRIDAVLKLEEVDMTFWRTLERFAPFGPGNRSPVFCFKDCYDGGQSRLIKHEHLKLHIRQEGNDGTLNGIAFYQGQHLERVQRGERFHLAVKLEKDTWQGRESVRFVVKDLVFAKDVPAKKTV